MPFEKWGYKFRGPYTSYDSLMELPGIYVIFCKSEETWNVVDVGEAANVMERVKNRGATGRWAQHCSGTIYYSATYTYDMQQAERMKIAQEIRSLEKLSCPEE